MRIVHVITRCDVGGAQSHVVHLAGAQQERGDDVFVLTGMNGAAAEDLRRSGVGVYLVPALVRDVALRGDARALVELDELLRALGPDVVHAHSSKAGLLSRVVARTRGHPVVYTAHGWPFEPAVHPRQRVISRLGETIGGHLGGEVVCVSEADAALARAAHVVPSDRLHVVENGIPDRAPCRRPKTDQAVVLTMVARFSAQKDHASLLRAVAQLRTPTPWRLQLVGSGPLLHVIRVLAAQLGLLPRVEFLGERHDVADIFDGTDIAVLSSHYEGLPLAILEACRAGLPWVATELPGTRVIQGTSGSGVLVASNESMARALTTLIDDSSARTRMGHASRSRFLEAFTLAPMVQKLDRVYEAARRRGHSGSTSVSPVQRLCRSGPSHRPRVQVLLATRNGTRFLSEQLESLRAQEDVALDVVVHDDASTDGTPELVKTLLESPQLTMEVSAVPRRLPGAFLHLLSCASPDREFYAFCDQDDVWHPRKLAAAATALACLPSGTPGLWACGYRTVDADGVPLHAPLPDTRYRPGFGNALVENLGPGCCMVWNASLQRQLRVPEPHETVMHDVWLYLSAAILGEIIVDATPYVDYRQHAENALGYGQTFVERIQQMRDLRVGKGVTREAQAAAVLRVYGDALTDEERDLAEAMATGSPIVRARHWARGSFRRHRRGDDVLLLGRLLAVRYRVE